MLKTEVCMTVFTLSQVWNTSTCEFVRTLNGHKRGIACLQYRDRLVVSGSSDNTIRSVNIHDLSFSVVFFIYDKRKLKCDILVKFEV